MKENKTADVYADLRAPVATVEPAIFNREIFALDTGRYTEDIPVWKWGSHFPGQGPSIYKDRERNSASREGQVGLMECWRGVEGK